MEFHEETVRNVTALMLSLVLSASGWFALQAFSERRVQDGWLLALIQWLSLGLMVALLRR